SIVSTPKGLHPTAQGRAAHPVFGHTSASSTPRGLHPTAQGRVLAHPVFGHESVSPTPKGLHHPARGRVLAHPALASSLTPEHGAAAPGAPDPSTTPSTPDSVRPDA